MYHNLLKLAAHFERISKHIDKLPGGLADKKSPNDFNQRQLEMGIKIEKEEHTDDDDIATEIAMDHLEEFPNYYDKLKEMEEDMEYEMENG